MANKEQELLDYDGLARFKARLDEAFATKDDFSKAVETLMANSTADSLTEEQLAELLASLKIN